MSKSKEKPEDSFKKWQRVCEEMLESLVHSAGAQDTTRLHLGKMMLDKTVSLLKPRHITLH